MPTCLRRRRAAPRTAVVVAAVLALLTSVLAGCASDPKDEPSPGAPHPVRRVGRPDHAPSLGECWQEPDYEVVRAWSWWQGSPPVDCAAEHNSITAAVGDLPADFPAPWSDAGERRDLTDEELGVVRRICTDGIGADIGLREGSRATWFWYLPSPREWAAGARWLRCDVAVIALGPLSPTVVEPLTADVADILDVAWDGYAFRLCIDTPYPAPDHQPWDDPDTNVAVSCDDGESQWHFGDSATFDGAVPPTQAEVLNRLEPYCAELVGLLSRTSAVIYFPNEQTWAQGTRTAKCWIY